MLSIRFSKHLLIWNERFHGNLNRRLRFEIFLFALVKSTVLFGGMMLLSIVQVVAQSDTLLRAERWSLHAQTTIIQQHKLGFSAPYSGLNSLSPQEEGKLSVTATIYTGVRLWKGASAFFNPELAGGSGLSGALGVASALNGETFRIGDPAPAIYVARMYLTQRFDFTDKKMRSASRYFHNHSDFNELDEWIPVHYLSFTLGKVSLADYFDDNSYSHDPRTQFMSWGLMDQGAWDYAANTRGYTPALVAEYVTPRYELRYGLALLPETANGNEMNWDVENSHSQNLELTRKHKIKGQEGAIRLLAYLNRTKMGSYREALRNGITPPDIESTRRYGRSKFGFGLNVEQAINNNLGFFIRAGWNDGRNETWAFTEIDRSLSVGTLLKGNAWKRPSDQVGVAMVWSGLSRAHRQYLAAGGRGFMLGDGNLQYAAEQLSEVYYSACLREGNLFLTGTWQLVVNPGYNVDRSGPVNVFSLRIHSRF